jgi:hypothetical protein
MLLVSGEAYLKLPVFAISIAMAHLKSSLTLLWEANSAYKSSVNSLDFIWPNTLDKLSTLVTKSLICYSKSS